MRTHLKTLTVLHKQHPLLAPNPAVNDWEGTPTVKWQVVWEGKVQSIGEESCVYLLEFIQVPNIDPLDLLSKLTRAQHTR